VRGGDVPSMKGGCAEDEYAAIVSLAHDKGSSVKAEAVFDSEIFSIVSLVPNLS